MAELKSRSATSEKDLVEESIKEVTALASAAFDVLGGFLHKIMKKVTVAIGEHNKSRAEAAEWVVYTSPPCASYPEKTEQAAPCASKEDKKEEEHTTKEPTLVPTESTEAPPLTQGDISTLHRDEEGDLCDLGFVLEGGEDEFAM
jgi:hypothetical protein